jgi:sensor histidine kinase YesM
MQNFFQKYLVKILMISFILYFLDKTISWMQGNSWGKLDEELILYSYYFLYSFVIGTANIYLVDLLNKWVKWDENPKKRAILGLVGALIVSMLAVFVVRIIIVLLINGHNWSYFITYEPKLHYLISLLISLVVVLSFYSYYFFKEISEKKIKEHQTVAQTETAKFESLKSQIDPHFLFNSLNVLTSLIGENPKQAENFTTKLSQVYRYVLEQKDKDLVPLEDELQFAKTYMDLLKMRFENAIQYQIPENLENLNYKVVPLSLQLILENAVKHNALDEQHPLKIEISIENQYLVIKNNINVKKQLASGTGFGLKNIYDRYQLISFKKIEIEKDETNFIIKIPLLTQKLTKMNTQNLNDDNRYIRARKQVDKIKELYHNLAAYLIVIPLLAYVNYRTYWEFKWFFFPMLGWGVGILFHFLDAFGYNWFLGKNWEEKKIRELMNQDDREKWM